MKINLEFDWDNVYFISDTHWDHGNILKYCNRPFLSDEEKDLLARGITDFKVSRESVIRHNNAIIDNINAVVKRDDILWHLGDVIFGRDYKIARAIRDRINCQTIFLTRGNHDKPYIENLFAGCYDQVAIRAGNQGLFLNHYPVVSHPNLRKGDWMCHGHVHGGIRRNPLMRAVIDQLLICDVGVDGPCLVSTDEVYNHKFRPWSMSELQCFMDFKATKFENNEDIA